MRALSTLLVLVLLGPPTVALAVAQEQPAPASVVIKTKTNAGNFAYKPFYRIYSRILGLLPPAPRMLDPVLQMSMPDLSLAEQDAYLKDGWNVAIVGDGLEIDLPTLRGGYYVFPTDEIVAAADATVMFNTRTEHNWVRLAWKVRLREAQTLGYQDFAKALAEVAAFQAKVPWYSITMREEKARQVQWLEGVLRRRGRRDPRRRQDRAHGRVGELPRVSLRPAARGIVAGDQGGRRRRYRRARRCRALSTTTLNLPTVPWVPEKPCVSCRNCYP